MSGYDSSQYKVCKECAGLNFDTAYRFTPGAIIHLPVYATRREALRIYKQRGVKHPERLLDTTDLDQVEPLMTLAEFFAYVWTERSRELHFRIEHAGHMQANYLEGYQGKADTLAVYVFPPSAKTWDQVQNRKYSAPLTVEDRVQIAGWIAPEQDPEQLRGFISYR
jgi:hypothetical protein